MLVIHFFSISSVTEASPFSQSEITCKKFAKNCIIFFSAVRYYEYFFFFETTKNFLVYHLWLTIAIMNISLVCTFRIFWFLQNTKWGIHVITQNTKWGLFTYILNCFYSWGVTFHTEGTNYTSKLETILDLAVCWILLYLIFLDHYMSGFPLFIRIYNESLKEF